MAKMLQIQKLLVVTHVVHYQWENQLFAYGPYAREIDIWADLFPQLLIAAPCRCEIPPKDAIPFTRPNIHIRPQIQMDGRKWKERIIQLLFLPRLTLGLAKAMHQADAIQVRCPGSLGLVGSILAPLFSPYRIAKYAGQWNGFPGETLSWRLQRSLLRSGWWGAPVIVYGKWPRQPAHVIPFFTSIMDEREIERAKRCASIERPRRPMHILYVGRLTLEKNVHVLLSALQRLQQEGFQFECRIAGGGVLQEKLERQAALLHSAVKILGPLPVQQVFEQYEWADILVLASETEGWPKAIAEGMAFGLVCIGSNRGMIPKMLGEGRGILVEPGDEQALISTLKALSQDTQTFLSISQKASAWAQNYSLERLRQAISELLTQTWGLSPLAPENP
jgi:glycosyltransferase involved in cell wall biosynthesis